MRLGNPLPLSGLRSEWFDWFLRGTEEYKVKEDSVALWALGGAGFLVKTAKTTLYVDPYCGGSIRHEGEITQRMIPIPFNASDVRQIDAVAITHEDPDHLSEDFVFPVSKNTRCRFIGPSSVAELLDSWTIPKERITMLGEWKETTVNDVKIIACPSNDSVAKTANTYVFQIGKIGIFHSGDSVYFNQILDIGKKYQIDIALIDVAVNPPGEKFYNNPGDVVQVACDLGAKIIVPIHWDIWGFSMENPDLVEAEVRLRRKDMKVVVLRIGDRFDYP